MPAKGVFVFVLFCILTVAFGKPQNEPCVVDGQTIQPGAHFYMGCSGFCHCGSGDLFGCVPLCPLDNYYCSPGTEAQFEDMIVDTGSKLCRCPNLSGVTRSKKKKV